MLQSANKLNQLRITLRRGTDCAALSLGCYTLQGRCVCVFGVKCGDLCGSEVAVAQGADWHSDAGGKWNGKMELYSGC